MNLLDMKYNGFLIDTNVLIGLEKMEDNALKLLEELKENDKLIICDITSKEHTSKERFLKRYPKLESRIQIIETIQPIALSDYKRNRDWLWDKMLFESNSRLDKIISIIETEYKESLHLETVENVAKTINSIHKNDIEIMITGLYYGLHILTLDKGMKNKYIRSRIELEQWCQKNKF
ncbi:hypothetical protein [Breznakia pachnodae]|uniref:Flagellin-specific chaperone FliS n=1 Tax=Breznakia pachnodae TaxID=265178 RepID=A0ABU0E5K1_9FIRM|nr:hypothetical protein [Breznakia pachnodae]MDQ0362111.1 flagellin-specific chaperone FliS [Breznakia pachnodae]